MALAESIISAVAGPAKKYLAVIEAGVAVAVVAGAFFFGMHVSTLHHEAETAKAVLQTERLWQGKVNAEHERLGGIAQHLEDKIDGIRPVNTTINRKVEKETVKTVYTDPACALPKSGVELINQNVIDLNKARKAKP